jgi:hypothetical protein
VLYEHGRRRPSARSAAAVLYASMTGWKVARRWRQPGERMAAAAAPVRAAACEHGGVMRARRSDGGSGICEHGIASMSAAAASYM